MKHPDPRNTQPLTPRCPACGKFCLEILLSGPGPSEFWGTPAPAEPTVVGSECCGAIMEYNDPDEGGEPSDDPR